MFITNLLTLTLQFNSWGALLNIKLRKTFVAFGLILLSFSMTPAIASGSGTNFHLAIQSAVKGPQKSSVARRGRWQTYRWWQLASRGGFPHMNMEATAYEPSPISCGPHANGYTATGMKAVYGVVAVDPRVIPLGTRLYVEGYGEAIAADTGGAIKGNRIDLFYPTYREAIQFGRRMVRVYLLGR